MILLSAFRLTGTSALQADKPLYVLTLLPVCAVPEEFMYNPVSRSYGEPHKRPEVQNATIEFIAPSEYMVGAQPLTLLSI